MSITTRTDEMIDEAREHIDSAAQIIARILGEHPWGASDYDQVQLAQWYVIIMQAKKMPNKEQP